MRKSTLLVLFGLLVASTADAADWGDLKVKFTFDGDAQKAAAITVNKDPEFCGKFKLVDERLVVNPKNKGIKNIVVFLYTRGSTKVPVHADYAKEADAEIVLNNADCRYEPHVICARIGQKFKVGNPDSVAHNSKIDFFSNTPANPIIPPMKSVDVKTKVEERLPARVSCSIHPWMEAWVVVKKHPYMGVTDENGELTIKNVPAGDWDFQFWQEKAGYLQEVVVKGKKTTWKRGRAKLKITKSGTDLGEVKVPASAFKK
jgi:plastocyanin